MGKTVKIPLDAPLVGHGGERVHAGCGAGADL